MEQTIEGGLKTFYEVGIGLLTIRDGRLYRQGHQTFEVYCKERWGFQRAHAYRLIDAAQTAERVSPIGDIKPANEAQVRPLTCLRPERQKEAWRRAVETAPEGKVTARHVETVVRQMKGPLPRLSAEEREQEQRARLAAEFKSLSRRMALNIRALKEWEWEPLAKRTVVKHLTELLAQAERKPGTKPQAEEI
jgi:hypothetical protein